MAWYRPTHEPFGDHEQEKRARYEGYDPLEEWGTRRNVPHERPIIQYNPYHGGWYQGNKRLRNFQPNYYFTRPVDGKRRGQAGRLKDALTNEGADVFITISGDKRTKMRDCPRRDQWTNRPLTQYEKDDILIDRDFRPQDLMPILQGARRSMNNRSSDHQYNFRTRKFEYPTMWNMRHPDAFWQNADWAPGARHSSRNPLNKQTLDGQWWTRVSPWAGDWAGGRPRPPF